MTNEELAERINEGEQDLVPTLWEQVERFVYLKTSNWYWQHEGTCIRCGVTIEDLRQTSFFAFLDAIKYYKPVEGYKFLTYITFPLRTHFNEICGLRTRAQSLTPLNNCISFSTALPNYGNGDGLTYEDTIEDESAAVELQSVEDREYNRQLHDALEGCVSTLPEVQANIIRYRYFEGLPVEKAGQRMGLSRTQCRNREAEGLRKLRTGNNRKRLEGFREDIISCHAYHSSFTLWKSTGMSSTEYTALKLVEDA